MSLSPKLIEKLNAALTPPEGAADDGHRKRGREVLAAYLAYDENNPDADRPLGTLKSELLCALGQLAAVHKNGAFPILFSEVRNELNPIERGEALPNGRGGR